MNVDHINKRSNEDKDVSSNKKKKSTTQTNRPVSMITKQYLPDLNQIVPYKGQFMPLEPYKPQRTSKKKEPIYVTMSKSDVMSIIKFFLWPWKEQKVRAYNCGVIRDFITSRRKSVHQYHCFELLRIRNPHLMKVIGPRDVLRMCDLIALTVHKYLSGTPTIRGYEPGLGCKWNNEDVFVQYMQLRDGTYVPLNSEVANHSREIRQPEFRFTKDTFPDIQRVFDTYLFQYRLNKDTWLQYMLAQLSLICKEDVFNIVSVPIHRPYEREDITRNSIVAIESTVLDEDKEEVEKQKSLEREQNIRELNDIIRGWQKNKKEIVLHANNETKETEDSSKKEENQVFLCTEEDSCISLHTQPLFSSDEESNKAFSLKSQYVENSRLTQEENNKTYEEDNTDSEDDRKPAAIDLTKTYSNDDVVHEITDKETIDLSDQKSCLNSEEDNQNIPKCSICRDYIVSDRVIMSNCQHRFHGACIDDWLIRNELVQYAELLF